MNEKKLMIVLFCVFMICLGGVVFLSTNQSQRSQTVDSGSSLKTIKTASSVGGPFTMVDHNGVSVTEKNYAGAHKLMFFGFTNCPGICPAELTKISTVLDILQEEQVGLEIKPLFVTIDPARDDAETMKEYVEVYDKRITGLTGSMEQVKAMKDAYKIYASKVEMEMMGEGNYMMDHSTFTYLMSPNNELLLVFDMQDKPAEIVAEIKEIL